MVGRDGNDQSLLILYLVSRKKNSKCIVAARYSISNHDRLQHTEFMIR